MRLRGLDDTLESYFSERNPPSYCTGVVPLKAYTCAGHVYYIKPDDSAGFIDLASKNLEQERLSDLCGACNLVPSSGQSTRQELNATRCTTKFDPQSCGILRIIGENLGEPGDSLIARFSKIVVYDGKCNNQFIGVTDGDPTLLVIFPIGHINCQLHLRKLKHSSSLESQGKQESLVEIDIAKPLNDSDEPSAAFAAIQNYMEYSIILESSNSCIVLSFDIEQDYSKLKTSLEIGLQRANIIEDTLHSLLSSDEVLPNGGFIGFGLQNEYRLQGELEEKYMDEFSFRGADSEIVRVCTDLGLATCLRIFVEDHYCDFLLNRIENMECIEPTSWWVEMFEEFSMLDMCQPVFEVDDGRSRKKAFQELMKRMGNFKEILWVIPPRRSLAKYSTVYPSEPGAGDIVKVMQLRGDACLLVKVGPPSSRKTLKL
ncbi:hypothetical protein AX16_006719 [Volvariella volvacea WC 439]|nr:hypothetical protein AX16_006719 [Volvariella volvacea WC 439]